jgi:hypothetical protein
MNKFTIEFPFALTHDGMYYTDRAYRDYPYRLTDALNEAYEGGFQIINSDNRNIQIECYFHDDLDAMDFRNDWEETVARDLEALA